MPHESTFMKIPDFFLVGAAKAGTTSLFDYLSQHRDIFVPSMKEPHYFSDYVHNHAPRLENLEAYLALFSGCRPDQLAGDLSTSYLYSARAPARIRALQPDAKIIMVLRNPIDRAYSFYWYNRNQFVEKLSFEDALEKEPERIAEGANFRFHYVESGRYHPQVKRYLDEFGADAVRIHLFEDLARDSASLCREILDFLGVPSDVELVTGEIFNRSGEFKSNTFGRVLTAHFPGKEMIRRLAPSATRRFRARLVNMNMRRPPAMKPEVRARLADAFREDVQMLSQLLNRDVTGWLDEPAHDGRAAQEQLAGGSGLKPA